MDNVVSRDRTISVQPTDANLAANISLLSADHPEGRKFRRLIKSVFDIDRIDLFAVDNGQAPGLSISSSESIELEKMGEGVRGALKILSEIALTGNHVFLVEEPENDLHPEALRRLLDIMIEAATDGSQFIISTHSDVVLRTLGAEPQAIIYRTELEWHDGIPETTYQPVSDTWQRAKSLRDLGYEESMPAGWLVFEEASAEYFINNALIPQFAPHLAGLKTVSAQGAGNLPHTVDALYRLVLFAHLHDKDLPRAWVIADGGEPGEAARVKLIKQFGSWPSDRFVVLSKLQIEDYYPVAFQSEASEILQTSDKKRQGEMKGDLVRKVCKWYIQDPESASTELAISAKEIIDVLQRIETQIGALFG
jgi:predicted ATPase